MGYISLTGNPITFTANRVNTISSLVLNGKTTQSGTGDPSPTNIRPIYGVGQFDMKYVFTGNEAWYSAGNSFFYDCYSILPVNVAGGASADRWLSNIYPSSMNPSVSADYSSPCIFAKDNFVRIVDSRFDTAAKMKAHIKSLYDAGTPLVLYWKSTSYSTANQVYCGLSITDETGYHGYAAGPMAPLYDGDTLDFMSGEVVRNKKEIIFDGISDGKKVEAAGVAYLHVSPNTKDCSSQVILTVCSHYRSIVFGVTVSSSIFFRNNGSENGITPQYASASDFNAYLSSQYILGTPVTIVYQLVTPTTETVAISEPITNAAGTVTLSAENTMNITYFQLEASNNKYQDIQITDNTLLTQFQQAWSSGDYATAFNIINNNPQLDTKSFVADVINTLTANLTYLQNLNDPTFKADRIQTSATPPVDLQVGQVYFKTL